MNFSWHTRVLLALASGVTLALSFPNYDFSLLGWMSVGLLVLAAYRAPLATAPFYGFLHSLIFYPLCIPWIAVVVRQYGNVPSLIAAGLVMLMAIMYGIIWAGFSWGVALASRKSAALACTLAPFLWVAAELVRTRLPIVGFPWNLAGYAASANLAFVQITAVTGIYGLSFVIAAYGSLLAFAILSGRQRAWKLAITATAAVIFIAVGGPYVVPSASPRYIAHLIQTDFPQSLEYPSNWVQVHAGELDQLDRMSVDAANRMPGLVVWPEVPAPFSLQDAPFAERATRIARDSGGDFLVGVEDWKKDSAGRWQAANSAVLLDASGRRLFTYDKIHLVPFGEYVPLRHWLTFAGKLTADIGDFTPGVDYRVGPLPGGTLGTFICYEAIFPNEIRRFAASGAELLINMSNDGWFGRSAAPAQHLMMSRVRAVESRRWLLRDTNNGFTASIDPYGRIVASLPTDIRGELDAPYDFRNDLSPYVRFGDWFAWLCVFVSMALLGIAIVKRAT